MRRGAQIFWFDIKTKVDGLSVSFYLLCLVFFVVQYSCSLIFSASSVQYSLFNTFSSLVFSIFIVQYSCSRCGSLLFGHIQYCFVMFSNFLLPFSVTSLVQ
jgi:hypothetical protein